MSNNQSPWSVRLVEDASFNEEVGEVEVAGPAAGTEGSAAARRTPRPVGLMFLFMFCVFTMQ